MAATLQHGFLCLQLIENHDTEKCILEPAQIETLKAKFPHTAVFMPPNPDLAANCVSTEWIAFPEYPFEIGLSFPFSPLISRFFQITGLAFTQLMPVGWRNLITIDRLSVELKLKVGLEELAFCYVLRSHGPHRYGFRAKNKVYSLVTDSLDQDRDWRRRFFYVRRNSLQGVEGFFSIWKQDVGRLDDLFPKRDDTLRNVEAVCLEPADKRKFVRPIAVGKVESAKEEVAQTMSSTTQSDNPFGASSLLARFKKPKVEEVKQAEGSSKPKLRIGDPVLLKKRKAEIVNVDDSDSIVAGLLEKIQDASSMLAKEVELWKAKADEIKAEDEKIFKEKDAVIKGKDRKIKDMEMEIKGLKVELDNAEKKRMEELHMQKEYYVKEAGRTLFEARIQMIEEYIAGKACEWNLEEERASLRGTDGSTFEAGEVSSKPQDVDQVIQDAGKAGVEG